ncbi:hypothetical protein C8T65DRAFT_703920 [Cerioporus squamosus]|nr:hypothetical protein C8T65DRAFT_703920 [Cerioporus squamosus]
MPPAAHFPPHRTHAIHGDIFSVAAVYAIRSELAKTLGDSNELRNRKDETNPTSREQIDQTRSRALKEQDKLQVVHPPVTDNVTVLFPLATRCRGLPTFQLSLSKALVMRQDGLVCHVTAGVKTNARHAKARMSRQKMPKIQKIPRLTVVRWSQRSFELEYVGPRDHVCGRLDVAQPHSRVAPVDVGFWLLLATSIPRIYPE